MEEREEETEKRRRWGCQPRPCLGFAIGWWLLAASDRITGSPSTLSSCSVHSVNHHDDLFPSNLRWKRRSMLLIIDMDPTHLQQCHFSLRGVQSCAPSFVYRLFLLAGKWADAGLCG